MKEKYTDKQRWEDMLFNNTNIIDPRKPYKSEASEWFRLSCFQPSRGYTLDFNAFYNADTEAGGVIDNLYIRLRKKNPEKDAYVPNDLLINFGDVLPKDLFWFGQWCQTIAGYYGVTKKSLIEEEKSNEETT